MERYDEVLLDQISGVVFSFKDKDDSKGRDDIISRGIIKFNIYKFINDFPKSDEIIRRTNGIEPYRLEPLSKKDKQYILELKEHVKAKYKVDVPNKDVSKRKEEILGELCFFLDNYEESIRYLIGSNNMNYDKYYAKVK